MLKVSRLLEICQSIWRKKRRSWIITRRSLHPPQKTHTKTHPPPPPQNKLWKHKTVNESSLSTVFFFLNGETETQGDAGCQLAPACVSIWPGFACSCDNLHSLWLKSNLHESRRKFFTVWQHKQMNASFVVYFKYWIAVRTLAFKFLFLTTSLQLRVNVWVVTQRVCSSSTCEYLWRKSERRVVRKPSGAHTDNGSFVFFPRTLQQERPLAVYRNKSWTLKTPSTPSNPPIWNPIKSMALPRVTSDVWCFISLEWELNLSVFTSNVAPSAACPS